MLETEFETEDGAVRVVDCMPPNGGAESFVRMVEGVRGSVPMRLHLTIRPGYGSVVPWVTSDLGSLHALAGPDAFRLSTPVDLRGEGDSTVAEFTVRDGERVHVRARLASVASAGARPGGRVPRGRPDAAVLGGVVGALHATKASGASPS